jgi:hypothetical protein
MAKMYPSIISKDCKSPGEREVFKKLKYDPDTKDWIVIHSLNIADHITQTSGEADFVIIVPNIGILVLEVKGHKVISRDDHGIWYFGREKKQEERGPFTQASDCKFSIIDYLSSISNVFKKIHIASGVCFPIAPFNGSSIEWHDWELVDSVKFKKKPFSFYVQEMIQNSKKDLFDKKRLSFPMEKEFNIEEVRNALRGKFEFHINEKTIGEELQFDLLNFTDEQFLALDNITDNKQLVFRGPAGSGKTLLAIETAKRLGNNGDKVLLLCFNKFLSLQISEKVQKFDNVTGVSLHKLMNSIVENNSHTKDSNYFQNELPDLVLEKLLDSDSNEFQYDYLVVDEAQDLLNNKNIDVLDALLKNGLKKGSWYFFGDFNKQNIFSLHEPLQTLKDRLGTSPFIQKLNINCRNTIRVGKWAEGFGQLTPGYKRFLRDDDNVQPEPLFFDNDKDQLKNLKVSIQKSLDKGYKYHEIIILTFDSSERSFVIRELAKFLPGKIIPFRHNNKNDAIQFTSIKKFKGLEAPVIIVTDVKKERDWADLIYIAATRALGDLYINIQENDKNEFVELALAILLKKE